MLATNIIFHDDFLITGEILQILKFYFIYLLLNDILFLRKQ